MTFIPFDLERWQSTWENRVAYNLSESGVHPLTVEELLAVSDTDPADLMSIPLVYSQSNGTEPLRAAIAEMYPGATADNVIVTVGGCEANFITTWTLVEPGVRVVVEVPNYLQAWGVAKNLGADVVTVALEEERDWQPDPDQIARAITPGTRLVIVTNPNNPTGRVLAPEAREAILERVSAVGAWLLADEVYRGAERNGELTPTLWGGYERVIVTGGLSKAYGLPGLRIGWAVGPAEFALEAWARHDYTVIGPSAISDFLAQRALAVRPALWERTRDILRTNYPTLEAWLAERGPVVSWRPPDAGAICLVRYHADVPGPDLVEHLRTKHDVLLVPGAHVGVGNYLRVGYGERPDYLRAGLERLARGLADYVTD